MKKIIALILAAIMLLSLVACADTNDGSGETTDAITTGSADTEAAGPSKEELAANASLEAAAKAVMNKYVEYTNMKATYDEFMAGMEEADRISFETFLENQIVITPVEKGAEWLMGFATTPTGFSEAYCFQPGMMGQAFIGYIFRLEEGTDVDAFKKFLTENNDPRWNICTMANTTVCESYGNLVYFNMLVVIDDENPNGFTEEQKNGYYNAFVESIEGSAK